MGEAQEIARWERMLKPPGKATAADMDAAAADLAAWCPGLAAMLPDRNPFDARIPLWNPREVLGTATGPSGEDRRVSYAAPPPGQTGGGLPA